MAYSVFPQFLVSNSDYLACSNSLPPPLPITECLQFHNNQLTEGGGRKYVHTFIIGKYKWLKSKLSAAIQKVTEVTKSKSHFYSVTSLRLVLLLWEESMATDRINCDWHSRKNPHPPVLPGLTSVERLPSDVNRGSLLVHGHLHQKNTDFSH